MAIDFSDLDMTVRNPWYDEILSPDVMGYPYPNALTVIVETKIQGQTTRSTYPAEYLGGRKTKWRIWYKENSSRPLKENERVVCWRARSCSDPPVEE